MKKSPILIILLISAVLIVSGCVGQPSDTDTSPEPNPEPQQNTTFIFTTPPSCANFLTKVNLQAIFENTITDDAIDIESSDPALRSCIIDIKTPNPQRESGIFVAFAKVQFDTAGTYDFSLSTAQKYNSSPVVDTGTENQVGIKSFHMSSLRGNTDELWYDSHSVKFIPTRNSKLMVTVYLHGMNLQSKSGSSAELPQAKYLTLENVIKIAKELDNAL